MHKNILTKILFIFFTVVHLSYAMEEPPSVVHSSAEESFANPLSYLPEEMLSKILNYSSPNDVFSLGHTEKSLFNNASFWAEALRNHFPSEFNNILQSIGDYEKKDDRGLAKLYREAFADLINVTRIFYLKENHLNYVIPTKETVKGVNPAIRGQIDLLPPSKTVDSYKIYHVFQEPLIGPDGFIYVFVSYAKKSEYHASNPPAKPLLDLCVIDPFSHKVIKRVPVGDAIENASRSHGFNVHEDLRQFVYSAIFGSDGQLYFSTNYAATIFADLKMWSLDIAAIKDRVVPKIRFVYKNHKLGYQNSHFFRGESNAIFHFGEAIDELIQVAPIFKKINFTEIGEVYLDPTYSTYGNLNILPYYPFIQDKNYIFSIGTGNSKVYKHDLRKKEVSNSNDRFFSSISRIFSTLRQLKHIEKVGENVYLLDPRELHKLVIYDLNEMKKINSLSLVGRVTHDAHGLYKDPQGFINVLSKNHMMVIDPAKPVGSEVIHKFSTSKPILGKSNENFVVHRLLPSNAVKLKKIQQTQRKFQFPGNIKILQTNVDQVLGKTDRSVDNLQSVKASLKRQAAAIIHLIALSPDFNAVGRYEANHNPHTYTRESLQACTRFAKQLANYARLDDSQQTLLTPERIVDSIEEITATYYVDFPNPEYFKMEDNEFSIGQRAVLFNVVAKHLLDDLGQRGMDELSNQLKQGLREKAPKAMQGDFDAFWDRTRAAAQLLIRHYDVPEHIADNMG